MPSQTTEISSPFLRLPSEIRNRIYELALTAPRSLVADMATSNRTRPVLYLPPNEDHPEIADHAVSPGTTERACDDQSHSFNQLKLVNKQLYYETKGLELQYNDIRIIDPTSDSSSMDDLFRDFRFFVAHMSPSRRAWLSSSSITLEMRAHSPGKPFHNNVHEDLFAFSQEHRDLVMYSAMEGLLECYHCARKNSDRSMTLPFVEIEGEILEEDNWIFHNSKRVVHWEHFLEDGLERVYPRKKVEEAV